MVQLSPERKHIAKVFKEHIDMAVAELGANHYDISVQGSFGETPIRVVIEVTAKDGIP